MWLVGKITCCNESMVRDENSTRIGLLILILIVIEMMTVIDFRVFVDNVLNFPLQLNYATRFRFEFNFY